MIVDSWCPLIISFYFLVGSVLIFFLFYFIIFLFLIFWNFLFFSFFFFLSFLSIPPMSYHCTKCPRVFPTAQGWSSHQRWKHPVDKVKEFFQWAANKKKKDERDLGPPWPPPPLPPPLPPTVQSPAGAEQHYGRIDFGVLDLDALSAGTVEDLTEARLIFENGFLFFSFLSFLSFLSSNSSSKWPI